MLVTEFTICVLFKWIFQTACFFVLQNLFNSETLEELSNEMVNSQSEEQHVCKYSY